MKYCFDIDGTICSMEVDHDYRNASPFMDVIDEINRLYDMGNEIILSTARGNSSGIDWESFTTKQMQEWGVRYHKLFVGEKPGADIYVDDKAININDWRGSIPLKRGIIAGAFDVIHAGYIYMFKDAKTVCNHLTIALQEDPSIERPHKIKPSQSLEDRECILSSIKYIDKIVTYKTESDLEKLLVSLRPDVRITGSDYQGKSFTGSNLNIFTYFHQRRHDKSSTKLKERISKNLL